MNDNDVLMVLIPILRNGLVRLGLTGITIKQSYQPTQTGVEVGPVLYLHKIQAARYGFPGKHDVYNPMTGQFDHTENTWREAPWQVSGLSTQNPANINQLTASDIVEGAADVLQQGFTRDLLLAENIGIYRITLIRDSYFVDDRNRHEQNPSFDFTLSYRREFSSTVPEVTDQTCNVRRV